MWRKHKIIGTVTGSNRKCFSNSFASSNNGNISRYASVGPVYDSRGAATRFRISQTNQKTIVCGARCLTQHFVQQMGRFILCTARTHTYVGALHTHRANNKNQNRASQRTLKKQCMFYRPNDPGIAVLPYATPIRQTTDSHRRCPRWRAPPRCARTRPSDHDFRRSGAWACLPSSLWQEQKIITRRGRGTERPGSAAWGEGIGHPQLYFLCAIATG